MKRKPSPANRHRRHQIESLEERAMLTAEHVFAQFEGELDSQPTEVTISVTADDFELAGDDALLGFHLLSKEGSNALAKWESDFGQQMEVAGAGADFTGDGFVSGADFLMWQRNFSAAAATAGLDPAAVRTLNQLGEEVAPLFSVNDVFGSNDSLAIVPLSVGEFTLELAGQYGTSGGYVLDVFLVGDADGDGMVGNNDHSLIVEAYGKQAGEAGFVPEADANLDGRITSFDRQMWQRNRGDSTSVLPLALEVNAIEEVTASATQIISGQVIPGAIVQVDTDGNGLFDDGTAVANVTGQFDLDVNLVPGTNDIELRTSDTFGQERRASLSISRIAADATLLRDGAGFAVEMTEDVTLPSEAGRRTMRFELASNLASPDDRFLVYLVDPTTSDALLDRGAAGTSLFAQNSEGYEFAPGIVQFDGSLLEIDVTVLPSGSDARLLFQLLNGDPGVDSWVAVRPAAIVADEDGESFGLLSLNRQPAINPGAAVDLASFSQATDIETLIESVRFDSLAGRFVAEVRLHNQGESIGRNAIVRFDGLPAGVAFSNASGLTAGAAPYVNFRDAIPSGGLGANAISVPVLIEIDNPLDVPFALQATVLVGAMNQAPTLTPLAPVEIFPGEYREVTLEGMDADGDQLQYRIASEGPLPTSRLTTDGKLILTPEPGQEGVYSAVVSVTDGAATMSQPLSITIADDSLTTTRVVGEIRNNRDEPIAGVPIAVGDVEVFTDSSGRFFLESDTIEVDGTLAINAHELLRPDQYPFLGKKFSLLLKRDLFVGALNEIPNPIFLPVLDDSLTTPIAATGDTIVSHPSLPGVELMVPEGSAEDELGNPLTGNVGVMAVPEGLTPAPLPSHLLPDTIYAVYTTNTSGLKFTIPAQLTVPNNGGYAPGTEMDLWSVDPVSGQFQVFGQGVVSEDGTLIEPVGDGGVISGIGGQASTNWRVYVPSVSGAQNDTGAPGCLSCKATATTASEVELGSGNYIETHELVTYQSLGETRGLTLRYDSGRARPQTTVSFSYEVNRIAVHISQANNLGESFIGAGLSLDVNGTQYNVPGTNVAGAGPATHFWSLSEALSNVPQGSRIYSQITADLPFANTGFIDYQLQSGVLRSQSDAISGSFENLPGRAAIVNSMDSPFGSGWDLVGLQRLVESPDGTSVLLVNGGGLELVFDGGAPTGPTIFDSPAGDFSTFERLADGTYRRTTTNQSVFEFDLGKRLSHIRDRNHNETRYLYNGNGTLDRIIDPVGLETVFAYDAGRVASITDPSGRVTQLTHDSNGDLRTISDPDSTARSWQYDDSHQIIEEVDKRGNRETVEYDTEGHVLRTTKADGTVVEVSAWDSKVNDGGLASNGIESAGDAILGMNRVAHFVDGNGHVQQTVLDEAGQTANSSNDGGNAGSVTRNEDNLVTESTNGRGFDVQFAYDASGNIIELKDDIIQSSGGNVSYPGQKFDSERIFGLGDVVIADLNGDGVSDLVTANGFDSNGITVLLGLGDGRLSTPRHYEVGMDVVGLVTSDFDGDGILDVATANTFFGNGVSVLLGVGDGTFHDAQHFASGAQVDSITASDFNNDGVIDLALTDAVLDEVFVLLGVGDGSFGAISTIGVGDAPSSIVATDINGDGISDLATANLGSNDVSILLGVGDGTFDVQLRPAVGEGPTTIAASDFNGDGTIDLVTGNFASEDISVLLGDGVGNFLTERRVTVDETPFRIVIGDFNDDQQTDLAVGSGGVSILLGQGDGTFTSGQRFETSDGSPLVTAGDLNGDGTTDVAIAGDGVTVALGLGDGQFDVRKQFSVGVRPRSVATSDFNGDGIADLTAANTLSGDVSILLGLGNGTFGPEQFFLVGDIPFEVATGDFDGDGVDDLVTANAGSNDVSILLGIGDGTFGVQQPFDTGNRPESVAVGDLNGDGALDLVTANQSSNDVSVLLGLGDGTFSTQERYSVGQNPRSVVSGDFNRDGVLDLVIANDDSSDVSVLLGLGDGTFGSQTAFSVGDSPLSVTVGDWNADGFLDLATANAGEDSVSILMGIGDGSFGLKTDHNVANLPSSVEGADLNSDGIPDLITTNRNSGDVSVLLGVGDGSFAAPLRFLAGDDPESVTTGDFDEDGLVDLAVANSTSNDISVLINRNDGTSNGAVLQPRTFTYDPIFNQLTSETDELGRQTFYDIDPTNGNTLSITQVVGELDDAINGETDDIVTSFTYTTRGLIDTQTDPLGRVTDFDYDAFGRVDRVTFAVGTPDEAFQTLEYDSAGNQRAIVDENGNRTEFVYDLMNRLERITEPDPDGVGGPLQSAVTVFTYDASGNVETVTDARGNVTINEYDPLNRLVRTLDAESNLTRFRYDNEGNLTTVIDPLGLVTTNVYDPRNRLVETVDPDGGRTRFRYDLDDNLIAVTDPVGNLTNFAYDSRDRLIRETDPLGSSILFDYDAVDNLISKTDRNGRITEFEYDDLDRLHTETWVAADGSTVENTVTYAYDDNSNLLSVVDSFSALAFTYDNRDRVKSVDNAGTPEVPNVVLTYTYDGVGNVTSVSDTADGGATTGYVYDSLNRAVEITQSGANTNDKLVDLLYNELGQFDSISRFSDLTRTNLVAESDYIYDSLNRLESLTHGSDLDPRAIAFYDFEYDSASRITALTDIDGHTDYSYDNRSQLTGADRDVADTRGDENYEYDANGNRVESNLHGTGYVTGDGNRLLSDGTYDYGYDDEGNMIRRTEIATGEYREFDFDHRNRLFRITDFSVGGVITQEVEFSYDALDRRISKVVDLDGNGPGGESATYFAYDREDVILDYIDPDGNAGVSPAVLDKRYLHGPGIDQVIAQEAAGQTQWQLIDHVGTTRDIVDNNGTVLNHLLFDSYGNLLNQSNSTASTRYLFTGREFVAELDLHYYRARFYDSTTGKFVGEDPLRFGGREYNLFRYTFNAPVQFSDPLGLTPVVKVATDVVSHAATERAKAAGVSQHQASGIGLAVSQMGAIAGVAAAAVAGAPVGAVAAAVVLAPSLGALAQRAFDLPFNPANYVSGLVSLTENAAKAAARISIACEDLLEESGMKSFSAQRQSVEEQLRREGASQTFTNFVMTPYGF